MNERRENTKTFSFSSPTENENIVLDLDQLRHLPTAKVNILKVTGRSLSVRIGKVVAMVNKWVESIGKEIIIDGTEQIDI